MNERMVFMIAGAALAVLLVVGLLAVLRSTHRGRRRRGGRRTGADRTRGQRPPPAIEEKPPPSPSRPVGPRVPLPSSTSTGGMPAARPASGIDESGFPLERCLALHGDRHYEEVLALATPALDRAAGGASAHELAALWSVTALARQALGDDDGARAAFDAAIAAAPPTERPTYQRHLAALALAAATRLLTRAEASADLAGEEQAAAFREAVAWCTVGLIAAPGDEALDAALAAARAGVWPAVERLATTIMHRGEFTRARRMAREALADPALPQDRREAFEVLIAATFSGEIGRLTAEAIRSVRAQTDADVLAGLERAEAMLTAIPGDSLTPARRGEVTRRLWWGYTTVGLRRLEAGESARAVDPLLRALAFESADPERREETHAALGRALGEITDARLEEIDALVRSGDPDAARSRARDLEEFLEECAGRGARREILDPLVARARAV